MNHFAKVLSEVSSRSERKKNVISNGKWNKKSVHKVKQTEDTNEYQDLESRFYINSFEKEIIKNENVRMMQVYMKNHPINFKLNIGAEVIVLPYDIVKSLKMLHELENSNVSQLSYGSSHLGLEVIEELKT